MVVRPRGLVVFIARRIVLSVGVLFGVIFITFFISRVAIPNPARVWAGPRASPAAIAALTARFHLADPIYVQFYYYLVDLLHGDWGVSPSSGQPVFTSIATYLPATVELTIAAIILTTLIGIPLGVFAATNKDGVVDHLCRVVSLSGVASPPFLAALLLQLIFFYFLKLFPDSGGRLSISVAPPTTITGLYTVDSIITGDLPAFVSALQHLVLPSFALAFLILGLMSRLVRASMLEALTSDYVRTLKAKGLSRRLIIYKHALRNSMTQPVTALSIYVAYTLGGSVVIESIFSWPGVGRYAAQAAQVFDLPAVMGTTIVFTLGVVFANLAADILLAVIDPRIRLR